MRELAHVVTDALVDRETRIRQGKVTSIQAGPPRTLTVNISGTDYPGIRVMGHVNPTVNEGIWILDMGIGRWLAFGSNTSSAVAITGEFIKVTGDTMTGALSMGGGGEVINFVVGGSYIGGYAAGVRQGYLQFNAGQVILAADAVARLDLNRVGTMTFDDGPTLAAQDATWVRGNPNIYSNGTIQCAGPMNCNGVFNGYTLSAGTLGTRLVATDGNGYIIGNYINMTADVVAGFPPYMAGQNGDNYMRWYSLSGSWAREMNFNRVQGLQSGYNWTDSAMCCNPASGHATISFHPGGIASTFRLINGLGNNMYLRSADGNGYNGLYAYAFYAESARKLKNNIASWPPKNLGAAGPAATDYLRRLRPVTFEFKHHDIEVPSLRRWKAWERLNKIRASKELPDYELPIHDCDIHECPGTGENPCVRVLELRKTRMGFIAEEVHDVWPDAVGLDIDFNPAGIEFAQITAMTVAAVNELTERVKVLEEEKWQTST